MANVTAGAAGENLYPGKPFPKSSVLVLQAGKNTTKTSAVMKTEGT